MYLNEHETRAEFIDMTTDTAPVPLPAGALLFGVSDTDGHHHIVTRDSATHALDLSSDPRVVHAAALCERTVGLAPTWGPYGREAADRYGRPCHDCQWILALHRGTVADEFGAACPDAVDAAAIAAAGIDPHLGPKLLTAIAGDRALIRSHHPLAPTHQTQLFAHASRHLPAVSICEECLDFGIHNAHDDTSTCPAQSIFCPACTPAAGQWAGEWAGTLLSECLVEAPCSVLTALAAHYALSTHLGHSGSGSTDVRQGDQ
ncbi:hypothetical protein [Mycobacterium avium]|uniref:hypothetical protein n=1 Tax=Mycobacterium avium TaxID=1764 RepID=UPI001594FDC0|nr:hypothetical protein [Mycobacterium avium]